MRIILVLAAVTVAFMPPYTIPMSPCGPQVLIQNDDCAAARRYANAIAETLGFSQAVLTCGGHMIATLQQPVRARMPVTSNLVAYSVTENPPFAPLRIGSTFEVPDTIPFAAASGNIVAYVKPDALLLEFHPDNVLETAFALEESGIARGDMISEDSGSGSLFVRVKPITLVQILKITRIAKKHQRLYSTLYTRTAFIWDCDAAIASLSGLVLAQAHERARVMAQAAHTGLDRFVGAVDPGGNVTNAICGLGKNATMHQLAIASFRTAVNSQQGPSLYATIVRSISAAWQLTLPANPPGKPYSEDPSGGWWTGDRRTAFVADGVRASADALVPNSVEPNRAAILIPHSMYENVRSSPYADDLTYVGLGTAPMRLAIVVHGQSVAQLAQRVHGVHDYVSLLSAPGAEPGNFSVLYSRDDCRDAANIALYRATRAALATLHGKAIRYLVEQDATAIGDVPCTYEPTEPAASSNSDASKRGFSVASVIAAY